MTPGRRWAAVLLLALIVFCERFAWYGARPDLISGLYQELSFSSAERSVFVEADRWFGLGGTLVAGVAATAAGPWGVLLVGSLVMAGGYAAYSLFDEDDGILTVEFKVNCIAPARGRKLIARGEVVKPGRTLTVTRGEVIAVEDDKETVCALMQQTLMRINGRDDIKG